MLFGGINVERQSFVAGRAVRLGRPRWRQRCLAYPLRRLHDGLFAGLDMQLVRAVLGFKTSRGETAVEWFSRSVIEGYSQWVRSRP